MNIKLQQFVKLPTKSRMDKLTNWVIVLKYPVDTRKISSLPYLDLLVNRRKRANKKAADKSPLVLDLPNTTGTHVALACIKPDISSFELLTLARKLVTTHEATRTLGIVVAGFDDGGQERVSEAVIAAVLAMSSVMPQYKSKPDKKALIEKMILYGCKANHGFSRTFAEAEGNALARRLSMLPANKLTPTDYVSEIKKLARQHKWKMEFYDVNALKRKKAGAFLAVAQGSPVPDAGIVRLQYSPPGKSMTGKLVLVGKGICYDTGGTNLKPANYMFGMHEDMQGSAVALGTLLALTRLKFKHPVECWMALAMNHIGPKAYKPNDVITASDGTTIEVVHTDAEGRMVLADTLALASARKPDLIIDYATLTGACIYSIGTAYSGVFTNQEEWQQLLIKSGKDSGERVWPFPLDEDYDKMIESRIADVKQCSQESGVDHILASRFLQKFIKHNTPWIHVDLSGSHRKGGLAHIPTDTTGFGIRFSLNLLVDKGIMETKHS